jgi:UDP-glucose 4-epimerase
MQPILVTGGAGFIGSHTCKALVAHGLQSIAFDNLSRGHREMVRWGRLVVGAGLESVLYVELAVNNFDSFGKPHSTLGS